MKNASGRWASLVFALVQTACGDDGTAPSGGGGSGTGGADIGGQSSQGGAGGQGGEGGTPTPIGQWAPNSLASEPDDTAFEPAIGADASGHVYVAYCNLAATGGQMRLMVSEDGGETFQLALEHKDPGSFSCDVSVAADDDGDAYAAWISYHYTGNSLTSSDVMLTASHDHGQTWSDPRVVESGVGGDPIYFNDRPWLTLDEAKTLHLSFAHIAIDIAFLPDNNRVDQFYARSEDGGETFSEPIQATPTSPDGRIILGSFGISAVGSDVFVPYSDITLASYALNEVGLMRLSPDQLSFSQEPVAVPDILRPSKGFPGIAGTPGNACFAFASGVAGSSGLTLQLVQTDDAAATFGPVGVLASNQHGFVYSATAAGADRCLVVWLDDRSGDEELYASLIEADGTIDEGVQVNDAPLELGMEQEDHSGDYLSATIAGTTAYTVWGDSRSGYQQIYVSSMRFE